MNQDLRVINQWAYQWKMEFNPDPNKQATELLFSCKKNIPNHPSLFFIGTVVPKVNEQKHLGMTLDSKWSFERHLNEKIVKAKRVIGIMTYFSKFLPLKTLDEMYKALVRSHIDYCDTIYHIPALNNQINANANANFVNGNCWANSIPSCPAITGAWQGSNRSKLYVELGWESLSDRRWCRHILQIRKIKNNMTPSYLIDKLPPSRRLLYRFKNYNTFHEIRCNTSKYKNSFFPDAIISWNNIITNYQNVPSFTQLKEHILPLIRPKAKSTFGVHDPLGLQFLFHLRVDLSPLRNHKRRYNFADSGICECNQDIENTSHFLFECLRYTTRRANLAVKVIDILQRNNLNHLGNQLELYLYGHRSLNPIDNRNVLLSTIEYIKDTQRFSS